MARRGQKQADLPLFDAAKQRGAGGGRKVAAAKQVSADAKQEAAQAERKVYTVAELTRDIKKCLEGTFGRVWLTGEISNARTPSSGHVYLTLKDEQSQISAVAFRNVAQRARFRLEDGLEVVVHGRITVYEPRGNYQIIVERIEPKGEGALQLAFKQLQEKLRQEGLFDEAHKKPLPELPRCIGIVTSPTGAAIRDMLDVILRRFPAIEVYIRPVRVQGDGAAAEIAEAIADFNTWGKPDVLIVGRGGGSLEDLWAFNEEAVARAIFASDIPIISAVGHEIDVTISDLVADRRALTPTAAGEMVVPDAGALLDMLRVAKRRLAQALLGQLSVAKQRLETLARSYGLSRPLDPIRQRQQRADDLAQRGHTAMASRLKHARERLASGGARLEGLSPLAVLGRGYSVTTTADGEVVRDAGQLAPADEIHTVLAKGRLRSVVAEVALGEDAAEQGGPGGA